MSFSLDKATIPSPPTPQAPYGQPPQSTPRVTLQQLVTDPEVLDKAVDLQQILSQQNFPAFCQHKIQQAQYNASQATSDAAKQQAESEVTEWTFMKILFEDEHSQRYILLKELGFEAPASSDIVPPTPTNANAPVAAAPVPQQPQQPEVSEEDFFNNFAAPPADPAVDAAAAAVDNLAVDPASSSSSSSAAAPTGPTLSTASTFGLSTHISQPDKPFVEDTDEVFIRQALVFGDFKSAVQRCLATGRMADAIVFASFGPPPLWEETRAEYFRQHKSTFIKHIMKNVSNSTLDEMVVESDLNNWKETLAILITYTTTNKYRELVNLLGSRLEREGRNTPAVVCYICAHNVDKAIEMWTSQGKNESSLLSLHHAVEKIAVLAHATHALQQGGSRLLSVKYSEYAAMLASQGNLVGAFNYLTRVATPNDINR